MVMSVTRIGNDRKERSNERTYLKKRYRNESEILRNWNN